ncbi:MAG: radical SAM protein [Candidatus Methanofastidiosa archaeon]|nr:radical SAM protein [Candidatus Methanofastidiosa archaeon]
MAHYRKKCISLLLTTQCNLDCKYCYSKKDRKENFSLNIDFAKRGIEDFFKISEKKHIRYFGTGEPTLKFPIIRKVNDFARSLVGEDLLSEIQTNGVFSNEIANWLSKNIDIIWISLDGIPEINDQVRVFPNGDGSSKVVLKNIKTILESKRKPFVGIRATITPLNLFRQIELVKFASDLGVKVVYSDPIFPQVGKNEIDCLKIKEDFYLKYAKEYLKAYKFANNHDLFYGSIFTVNFDEKTNIFCRSCIPCPHLTPDGYVSNCDMATLKDALPDLIYGKWEAARKEIEYFPEKIARIKNRTVENLETCSDCEIKYNCAGACFGEGFNETGKFLGVKNSYCEAIRFLAKNMPLNFGLSPFLHP